MITKFIFEGKGRFKISGILRTQCVDFETKTIDTQTFFPLVIESMIRVKKTVNKKLADDNKILSDERIEVVHSIDKFLTLIFSFAIIISNDYNNYSDELLQNFSISLKINKMRFFEGSGLLLDTSSKDIIDYDDWLDNKIINVFKNIIVKFNDSKNKEEIKKTLIQLIHNIIGLRYKVEYI